jgi:argininosuccinate lyase
LQPERIGERLDEGFADATVMAEYLVKKGIPFRTAHGIVGTLVAQCDQQGYNRLCDLDLHTLQEQCPAIEADVYDVLGPKKVVQNYVSPGAGGVKQLEAQLERWRRVLGA